VTELSLLLAEFSCYGEFNTGAGKKVAGTLRNFSEITVWFVSVRKSRSGAGKQAHVCCHGEEEEKKLQV
jgi:hypothetical protein